MTQWYFYWVHGRSEGNHGSHEPQGLSMFTASNLDPRNHRPHLDGRLKPRLGPALGWQVWVSSLGVKPKHPPTFYSLFCWAAGGVNITFLQYYILNIYHIFPNGRMDSRSHAWFIDGSQVPMMRDSSYPVPTAMLFSSHQQA